MKNRNQRILENGIYILIWTFVFIAPIFGYRNDSGIEWFDVRFFWMKLMPFLFLFIITNYLLIPCFLVKKKYALFVISVFALIGIITALNHSYLRKSFSDPPHVHRQMKEPGGFRPSRERSSENKNWSAVPPKPKKWRDILNDCLVAILLVGFNVAIHLFFKSIQDARRLKELESQNLKAELNYLKAQINPHFFMNTLNNIHALIDIDSEKAKDSVIELSRIMRYVLYDTNMQTVSLLKEVDFINNFIALMRIRFSDDISIKNEYPEPLPDIQVPPLMLVTLIENAFKHGISYRKKSYIYSVLSIENGYLSYVVKNSISKVKSSETGVGMENLHKRLSLLYETNYGLEVISTSEEYKVILKIPIS